MTVTSPASPTPGRRVPATLVFGVVLVAGALLGAYVDWRWWLAVTRTALFVSLGAVLLIVFAGAIAVTARSRPTTRRRALIAVTASVGVLLGQVGGPSREELLRSNGSITIHLTSPFEASATGGASCVNVASGSDFLVESDPDSTAHFETDDPALVLIYLNGGDRWEALDWFGPRKDGVQLRISVSPMLFPENSVPVVSTMEAGPSSVLVTTFTSAGGSIAFSNLAPRVATDVTGPPMDLVGTVEWTCGPTT